MEGSGTCASINSSKGGREASILSTPSGTSVVVMKAITVMMACLVTWAAVIVMAVVVSRVLRRVGNVTK